MKNIIKLLTILLTLVMIISTLASCNMLSLFLNNEDVTVTIEYYIDGKLVSTETLTATQIAETERYTPEEKSGYRFIGWFIDETCEIPYSTTDLIDPENKAVKLYGKYLPIGTGTTGCDHFWIMGYCRLCEAICAHSWKCAVCTICDTPCDHGATEIGNTCKTCGKQLDKNKITITIGAPDEQEESDYATVEFDTAMYIDEILAHCMTYWGYKFRNDIFDIWVDNELVTDGSTLISKDCTVLATLKKDVIRVNVTMIDRQGDRGEQTLYLPKEGITLEKLGLIVFPQSGGFDKLLSEVDITVDGQKITDGSYVVNKNCSMTFTAKKGTGGNLEEKEITLSLEIVDTGSHFQGSFPVGIKLSLAIDELCGRVLERMLANGQVYLNGERIYENVELTSDAEVRYIELEEGRIIVNFHGSSDLGKGESVSKTTEVNAGMTFEEIVYELFEMSWEEYEDRFYNTRITGNGDYTTWIPVYKDTVISNSVYIDAIGYYPHEKTDEVKLSIDITGIFEGEVTVPYDTLLSEAFELFDPPLDFDTCLEEWDMFINVYALVSDSKLKYNSFIYGSKPCTKHEWKDQICSNCGITCNYNYSSGDCPVCGAYHPSEEQETVQINLYSFDKDGQMIGEETIEILNGSSFKAVFEKLLGDDLDKMMNNGTFLVNGTIITEANADEVRLYHDIKVEYYEGKSCEHNWSEDGLCTECGRECDHRWINGGCTVCGKPCDHVWENNACIICGATTAIPTTLTFTYYENICGVTKTLENQTIQNGATISDLMKQLGLPWELIERGEIYINEIQVDGDHVLTHNSGLHFKIEFIRTQKECQHSFDKGVCIYCYYVCPHRDDGSGSNICIICKMTISSNPPVCTHDEWTDSKCVKCGAWCNGTLEHSFADGRCTNCGCTYGEDDHYILVVWANVDPYYVLYSTTFADYCELANIQADYTEYRYYQSILPYFENPDTERRELSPETVLGEFGNNTHINCELINTGVGHIHEWYNSACVLCAERCSHSFAEDGKCSICKCTSGGDDHYITVTTDYWANGDMNAFVSEKFVPYSTTLYELLDMTWEAGYSYATQYYRFFIADSEISSNTVLGRYGDNVEITTLAIAPTH